MAKRKRKRWEGLSQDIVAPTVERGQHDPVEREARQIVDAHGNIGNPFRVVDVLTMMFRRGTITDAMTVAGYRFRDDFSLGGLVGLRAAPLIRIGGGGQGDAPTVRQQAARDRVADALLAAGGRTSPAGACLWHVVGEGMNMREWAMREGWTGRPLKRETAAGILIGALGMLVAHYGLDRARSS